MAIIANWSIEKKIHGPPWPKIFTALKGPKIFMAFQWPKILLTPITLNTCALFKMKRGDKQNFLKIETRQQQK